MLSVINLQVQDRMTLRFVLTHIPLRDGWAWPNKDGHQLKLDEECGSWLKLLVRLENSDIKVICALAAKRESSFKQG